MTIELTTSFLVVLAALIVLGGLVHLARTIRGESDRIVYVLRDAEHELHMIEMAACGIRRNTYPQAERAKPSLADIAQVAK